MPTWESEQYLRFARERTRPAADLAARIERVNPATVIDLGCGPGNSTAVLRARWPAARLVGLDSSEAMIETARRDHPGIEWRQGNIAQWQPAERYDIIFSNAALQWVPDHGSVCGSLVNQLTPDGTLAFQVPDNYDAAPHRLMRELGGSRLWRHRFTLQPREWHVESRSFYYDVLAGHVSRVDLWQTEYLHVLDGPEAIVEWYKGTGLRPWLDALPTDDDRNAFLTDYTTEIARAFSRQRDGRVLFPFKRLFVVAYR